MALERPYRLAVRTPPFHGGGTGSIPVRVAKKSQLKQRTQPTPPMIDAALDRRRKIRRVAIWVVISGVVALPIVLMLLPERGDTVRLRIVDAKTGDAVTNASAIICRRWTRLPVENLHLPALKSWQETRISGKQGAITIRGVPTNSPSTFFVVILAPYHRVPIFERRNGCDFLVYGAVDSTKLGTASNLVTIALDRGL